MFETEVSIVEAAISITGGHVTRPHRFNFVQSCANFRRLRERVWKMLYECNISCREVKWRGKQAKATLQEINGLLYHKWKRLTSAIGFGSQASFSYRVAWLHQT